MNLPKLTGYIIYHPNRDITCYSAGGNYGMVWSKKPKIWRTLGHLRSHLAQYIECVKYSTPRKYEISRFNPYDEFAKVFSLHEDQDVSWVREEFDILLDKRHKEK